MTTPAPDRTHIDALLAHLSESRAAVFDALRPLHGPEFSAVRRPIEELVDAENFVDRVLSRIYDIEIWGSAPSTFATPEEAVSGLIDSRETLLWTLKPALDEHLDRVFKLSRGDEFTIAGALRQILDLDRSTAAIASGD